MSCIVGQEFKAGRATNYAYFNGACGFSWVYPDESLGSPLHVMAIADCSSIYSRSCGNCFEVKCRNAVITDDNGVSLDRTTACYDETSSVVLRTVDACPAIFSSNYESNRRWCTCRSVNTEHFDISTEAFTQLADKSVGVIGTSWRQVACDYQPENPAPVRDTTVYAEPIPPDAVDQHRTMPDWRPFVASYVEVQAFQETNPSQVGIPNVYSSIAGDLLPGWSNFTVRAGNSEMTDAYPPPAPVKTGRGGQGDPLCTWAGYGHGVGFSSNDSTAVNTTVVSFWTYTNGSQADLDVTIGQNNSSLTCDYISLAGVPPTTVLDGWSSYTLFVPSFNTSSTSKVFEGCHGRPAANFDAVYLLSSALDSTWLCLDDVAWY